METEPQIIQNFIATGKAKLIYRHLTQLGDGSQQAAEASECAADQGKFWDMRGLIYARQREMYQSGDLAATLTQFAGSFGLDTATFGACLRAQPHHAEIVADFQAATAAGVQSRPVFDINGQRLVGALPYDTFKRTIEGT